MVSNVMKSLHFLILKVQNNLGSVFPGNKGNKGYWNWWSPHDKTNGISSQNVRKHPMRCTNLTG